ncbi:hypothetical protein IFM89_009516 [Coptis chinensis]|uniref:TF-B3 domain-containing protein n=1 Tax=Coptis chinensis TaxID=261450 RepID=A0A835LDV7_9MAGN|nr:hypothetical protein IFM89_009516 [Coptis chinensis]
MQHGSKKHQEHITKPGGSEEKGPSFFKIISSSIIQGGQLEIPKRFISNHGKRLPNVVNLKVPSGAVSRVKLREVDGNVWLGKGWQEFMERHYIDVGHFLVFTYDGESQFYVVIFDMSCNEIHYFNDSNNAGESSQVLRKGEDGNRVAVCHHSSNGGHSMKYMNTRKFIRAQLKLQAVRSFKSNHPFFRVKMRPSYVNSKYVPIPKSFSKKYLPRRSENFKIQASDGKEWAVGYNLNKNGMRLGKGVSAFLSGCKIKLGDICIFELVNRKEFELKVKKIPTAFVDGLNGGLPKTIILKSALGRLWSIRVKEVEDFRHDCSLRVGEFLVFRYDGNSTFEVIIYDHSCCEGEEELAGS